jgi:ribosome recycling factor
MTVADFVDEVKKKMEASLASLQHEFKGLRTGRASPALLEHVVVDAYGDRMALQQVGSVTAADARTLTIQLWDKGLKKSVEKAIADANLGVNPVADGEIIRIVIPALTEERRLELVKLAGRYAEQNKVAIRNIRRDAMERIKKMEKDGELTEDQFRQWSDQAQKTTDLYVQKIDQLLATKEQEIRQI